MYDINQIRADFPILGRTVYGKPLVYLDNGATTQKPRCVVEAITNEYYNTNANVHRGVHFLSQQATELHEASRETVRRFVNARSTNEIVFTRGTTESINLLAATFCQSQMQAGDEVIVSTMEHHSNIVPWQLQAMLRGIVLRVIPMDDDGNLLLDEYERLFSPKTKLVSIAHVSNVLGTVNPVREMIATAHSHGVPGGFGQARQRKVGDGRAAHGLAVAKNFIKGAAGFRFVPVNLCLAGQGAHKELHVQRSFSVAV